jgi:hypothetical protein
VIVVVVVAVVSPSVSLGDCATIAVAYFVVCTAVVTVRCIAAITIPIYGVTVAVSLEWTR